MTETPSEHSAADDGLRNFPFFNPATCIRPYTTAICLFSVCRSLYIMTESVNKASAIIIWHGMCYGVYRLYAKVKDPALRLGRKIMNKDWIFLIPFVYLSLKVRLQYFYFLASPGQSFPQSDDSKWYIQYAYTLIAEKKIGLHMNDLMYMGYNVLLALLLAVFKDPVTVVFIQAVVAGLSVILVYQISRMLFNRLTAIIASYLYCYHTWGITLWSMYVLADSFFISLLLLCVYLLLKCKESDNKFYKIAFAASAIFLAVFKPTGLLAVAFIALYIVIGRRRATLLQVVKKVWLPLASCAAVAIAAGVFLLAAGKLDPLIASMQLNIKMVLYNIYAKGWIYDSASPFDHPFKPDYEIDIMNSLAVSFIVNNWDHVSVLYAKRMIAFLGRWVWQTDLTSIKGIVSFAENMLPTVLFITGIVVSMTNELFRKASIIWLMVLAVFLFCIVFFIDGMYRYKAPAIPFITIGVAYGADRVIRGFLFAARSSVRLWGTMRRRGQTSYSSGM